MSKPISASAGRRRAAVCERAAARRLGSLRAGEHLVPRGHAGEGAVRPQRVGAGQVAVRAVDRAPHERHACRRARPAAAACMPARAPRPARRQREERAPLRGCRRAAVDTALGRSPRPRAAPASRSCPASNRMRASRSQAPYSSGAPPTTKLHAPDRCSVTQAAKESLPSGVHRRLPPARGAARRRTDRRAPAVPGPGEDRVMPVEDERGAQAQRQADRRFCGQRRVSNDRSHAIDDDPAPISAHAVRELSQCREGSSGNGAGAPLES